MEAWKAVYTDDQREVVRHTYFTVGLTNMAQLGRLARAGELQFEGKSFPAFEIPDASVRDIVNKEKRRRSGKVHTELVKLKPKDAVETLRQRLLSLTDTEVARLERAHRQKPKEPIDAEQIRKLARATRELAALPGPGEHSTTTAPGRGAKQGDGGEGTAKPNSIAGGLIEAMKPGAITAPAEAARDDAHIKPRPYGDRQATGASATTGAEAQDNADDDRDDSEPGAFAASGLAGLRALGVSVTTP